MNNTESPMLERFPFSVVPSELGKRMAEAKNKKREQRAKSPPLKLCLRN